MFITPVFTPSLLLTVSSKAFMLVPLDGGLSRDNASDCRWGWCVLKPTLLTILGVKSCSARLVYPFIALHKGGCMWYFWNTLAIIYPTFLGLLWNSGCRPLRRVPFPPNKRRGSNAARCVRSLDGKISNANRNSLRGGITQHLDVLRGSFFQPARKSTPKVNIFVFNPRHSKGKASLCRMSQFRGEFRG